MRPTIEVNSMSSARQGIRRWWKWALIIIGLILLGSLLLPLIQLFLAVVLSPSFNSPNGEFSAETTDRKMLQANAEILIPPSATEIRGYVTGFQDVTTYVRFIVSASDFDDFAKSISCILPPPTTDTQQRLRDSSNLTWWKPSEAQNFRRCDGAKEHLVQRVFIDTTQPDRYIVYVMASTQ